MSSEAEPGLHLRLKMDEASSSLKPAAASDVAADATATALVDPSQPSPSPNAEGWESVQAEGAAVVAEPSQPIKEEAQPEETNGGSGQTQSGSQSSVTPPLAFNPPCHSCGQSFSSTEGGSAATGSTHATPCLLPCGHVLCALCIVKLVQIGAYQCCGRPLIGEAKLKALSSPSKFKSVESYKSDVQNAVRNLAKVEASLELEAKAHHAVRTGLTSSLAAVAEVRAAVDAVERLAQEQLESSESKQQAATARSAQLTVLQQESTDLLQASDANQLKLSVRQLQFDQQSSAQTFDRAVGSQQLNASLNVLRKTALAVPFQQTHLIGSTILNELAAVLQQMMGDMKLVEFELLFCGSRDGWTYADWAAKCVGQSNTLTLIKVAGNDHVMGYFAVPLWSARQAGKWVADPTLHSFFFSLVNEHRRPVKFKLTNAANATAHCSSYLSFGGGAIGLMNAKSLNVDSNAESVGLASVDEQYERKCGLTKLTFELGAGFMSGMPGGKFACAEVEVFVMKPQQ